MKIHITYAATKNAAGGWIPVVENNGRRITPEWMATGLMCEANALVAAMKLADEEAARYVGDWDVVVEAAPQEGNRP